jgi:cob(I)alamin adenosyltransferase
MAFKIYTKTGDLGKTSLIGGTKVPKSNIRIEAYGTVDELNSFVGLTADQLAHEPSKNILKEIQDRLFTIGSSLACDPDKESKLKIPDLIESDITLLEIEISTAHVTRCVCRRAERICVNMQENDLFVDPLVIKYLNRLSDYLFVLARYAGHLLGVEDIPWKPRV